MPRSSKPKDTPEGKPEDTKAQETATKQPKQVKGFFKKDYEKN